MAEPKSFWSSVKDLIFPHLFSDALVTGTIAWFQGKRREGTGTNAPYVHVRGQWVADMGIIEAGDPAHNVPPKPLPNIWAWKEKAGQGQLKFSDGKIVTENKFVALLAQIPPATRPTVYPQLNGLGEAEFIQRLDSLEHDVLYQTGRRWLAFLRGRPWSLTKTGAGKVRQRGQQVNVWLDQQAQAIRTQQAIPTPGHPVLKFFGWVTLVGFLILATILLFVFLTAKGSAEPKGKLSCAQETLKLRKALPGATDQWIRKALVDQLAKKHYECSK